MTNPPVIFLIFNRPDVTRQVFERIRAARPSVLLLVADGPRPEVVTDLERCRQVREVVENVDWPCTVMKNYASQNLGCRKRVSSGLDWAFAQVSEAIVLEDDCLPEPGFFRFCREMLEIFRHDDRVMMISGTNMLGEWKSSQQSYHFSYYGGIWGWASWQRAWNHYDVTMGQWADPAAKTHVRQVLASSRHYRLRAKMFDMTLAGKIDTWDYQWSFARLVHSGLSVVPSVNLISNLGFGTDATHTTDAGHRLACLPTKSFLFPIKCCAEVTADREYDEQFIRLVTTGQSPFARIIAFGRAALGRVKTWWTLLT